ncbi:MAG: pentapeptide repeat-containing protein [Anaerolineae bacterium]|nr:pentapeptide repeat-containing protein [Anaerolineae bacterium]
MRMYDDDRGWYSGEGNLLVEENLAGANLAGVDLRTANINGTCLFQSNLARTMFYRASLEGADLWGANLNEADLGRASLKGADLRGANLTEANLGSANLEAADLRWANLQGTNLRYANLVDANLWGTNLQGADLWRTRYSERTALPNSQVVGTDDEAKPVYDKYYNTELGPEQMQRYTDPTHPDFWDPCVELEEKPWYCADAE